MKKRRDYNVKVALRGFLLVFVFSWKFLTPIQLKVKPKRGVGTAHCNRGPRAVPKRYRGGTAHLGTAHCNRGPERHRSGTEAAPRIVIEGPSGTEAVPRIVLEGPSGTEAVPRIVIEGPSGTEAVPRIVMEGPSGTEALPRIVIEGPSGTEAVPRIVTESPSGTEAVPRIVIKGPSRNEVVPNIKDETSMIISFQTSSFTTCIKQRRQIKRNKVSLP